MWMQLERYTTHRIFSSFKRFEHNFLLLFRINLVEKKWIFPRKEIFRLSLNCPITWSQFNIILIFLLISFSFCMYISAVCWTSYILFYLIFFLNLIKHFSTNYGFGCLMIFDGAREICMWFWCGSVSMFPVI